MSFAAKAVGGGILALLGLALVKFMLGMFGAVLGFMMFFLVKIVPLILIGMLVIWLFRKLSNNKKESTA
ncbi:MAG: hypothetical protein ACRENP_14220 [Longimicrobiales bacterium]